MQFRYVVYILVAVIAVMLVAVAFSESGGLYIGGGVQPRQADRVSRGQTRIEVLLRAEAFDDDRAKPTCAILEPGVVVEIEGLREMEAGDFVLVKVVQVRRDSMIVPPSGICRGWTRKDYIEWLLY